jgi:predicted  nucleic acid-binding Zn-ribbon protein
MRPDAGERLRGTPPAAAAPKKPAPAAKPAPAPKPKAAPAPKAKAAPKPPRPANVAVKAAADKVAKINKQVDAAKQKLEGLKGQLKAAKADLAAVKGGAKAKALDPAVAEKAKADGAAFDKMADDLAKQIHDSGGRATVPSTAEINAHVDATVGKSAAAAIETAKAMGATRGSLRSGAGARKEIKRMINSRVEGAFGLLV